MIRLVAAGLSGPVVGRCEFHNKTFPITNIENAILMAATVGAFAMRKKPFVNRRRRPLEEPNRGQA